jgi:hypothetical protein
MKELTRVARWFIFIPINPNLGKFWRALEIKILVCFMKNWKSLRPLHRYNLWLFGIIFGHLVYFSRFGKFWPRKIWQPRNSLELRRKALRLHFWAWAACFRPLWVSQQMRPLLKIKPILNLSLFADFCLFSFSSLMQQFTKWEKQLFCRQPIFLSFKRKKRFAAKILKREKQK